MTHFFNDIRLCLFLQRIPLWCRKRRGPVTALSAPGGSVCTLSLFTSPSRSAVVVWARPGDHTVRNVRSQVQVSHGQRHTHKCSQPREQNDFSSLGRFWFPSFVFNGIMCLYHYWRKRSCRSSTQEKKNAQRNSPLFLGNSRLPFEC